MLKFIKHHLDTIGGIEIFPLISFVIFFLFFVIMFIWVIKADKQRITEIKNIPINDSL